MWYIMKNNNNVIYSSKKPEDTTLYFTIDKLTPMPKDKYVILQADFSNQTVWFEKRALTKQENIEEQIIAIDQQLNNIDQSTGLTRIVEDVIIYTGVFSQMYNTTQELIQQKNILRENRKQLVEQLAVLTNEDNLSTETEVGEIVEETHENL